MKRFPGVCWCVLALFFGSAARGDEVIETARATLYTQREKSLLLLEEAVQKSPHNVAYWAELISDLDVDSQDDFAERASRTALRLNPRNPTLLLARARLLPAPSALEVLDELAQIPAEKARAARLIEWVSLGLSVPDPTQPQPPTPYVQWGERLLLNGRLERALEVLDEGLKQERSSDLLGRKAMVLALLRRPREAVQVQREAHAVASKPAFSACQFGPTQRGKNIDELHLGPYLGLGDCLLLTQQPQLALEFLTLDPRPNAWTDARQRLRALALFRSKKRDEALRLIEGNELPNHILRLYFRLQSKDKEAAAQVAETVFAYLDSLPRAYSAGGGPLLRMQEEGISLSAPYAQAVQWLLDHYPQRARKPSFRLPAPRELLQISAAQHAGNDFSANPRQSFERATAQIERLQKTVARSRAQNERWEAREQLRRALGDAGRFDEAATVLRANLREMPPQMVRGEYFSATFYTSVEWSLLRRRADAERLFRAHSAQLAGARAILTRVEKENRALAEAKIPFTETPTVADVQSLLVALGPGVLAPVWNKIQPLAITGRDRRLLWSVVAQTGSPQDMPVVIDAFKLVEPSSPAPDIAAIEACLSALSGLPAPTGTQNEKLEFWTQWWQQNAARIIEDAGA